MSPLSGFLAIVSVIGSALADPATEPTPAVHNDHASPGASDSKDNASRPPGNTHNALADAPSHNAAQPGSTFRPPGRAQARHPAPASVQGTHNPPVGSSLPTAPSLSGQTKRPASDVRAPSRVSPKQANPTVTIHETGIQPTAPAAVTPPPGSPVRGMPDHRPNPGVINGSTIPGARNTAILNGATIKLKP